uniref:GAF domain-containing protein n=1 Tax=Ciona savignyi TaxID=51511 RepID=H2ZJ29_CIOSA
MLQEDLSNKVSKLWASRSIDDVLKEVVLQVSELIQCERYTLAVALIDNCNIEGCLMFAKSYDMLLQKPKSSMFDDEEGEITKNVEVNKLKKNDWVFSHKVIIKAVETKQVVNVAKITPFSEFKLEDAKKEFSLKSALCVSFYDGTNRLLGVLYLGNKKK